MTSPLLFVTGTGRSGTTLVDKLLWGMGGVDSFSQPLPLLFVELKRLFLERQMPAANSFPPLSDQQFGAWSDPLALSRFLETYDLETEMLRDILTRQIPYSGQYFKPHDPFRSLDDWQGGGLGDFVPHYLGIHRQKEAAVTAWKETFAEEFMPYWLSLGVRILLVIRDPRDVLASINHGESADHAGLPRPLLFVARQWRKSALYALGLRHEMLRIVQYEDLVSDTEGHLGAWSRWLGLPSGSWSTAESLIGQDGKTWQANSSFGREQGVFHSAIGRYATQLPENEQALIEALCFAEMTALGYAPGIEASQVDPLLAGGWPGETLHRPDFAPYLMSDARIAEERARWSKLAAPGSAFAPQMFIFTDALKALRAALAERS